MKKGPFTWLYFFVFVTIFVSGVIITQEKKNNNAEAEEIVVEKVGAEAPTPAGEEEVVAAEETTEVEPTAEEATEPAQEETQPKEATEEVAEEAPAEPTEEAAVEPEEATTETEEPEAVAEEEAVVAEEAELEPTEEEMEPEAEPEKVELGPDEIMGIDTVDLEDPQGNWLYKRVWWERAEAKYEKIRTAVTSVMEIRTKFFAKRAELDKTVLDPFYIKIGFSQGELQQQLTERIATLERELQEQRDARLLERLESDKQELEQLRQEVQEVAKKDEEVENAILMLVEQANKMRNYEQQAWQDFKNIARVLDDKKARELFYKVDGAWRNIQELQRYVEKNFSAGFDALIENVSKKVQQVDSAMQALQEKGIDLKKRAEEEGVEEEEEAEKPQGIIARYIISPITSFMKAIWNIITWPIRKIMGTTAVAEEEEVVEEEVVAEEEPVAEPAVSTPPSIPTPPAIAAPTPSIEPAVQEEQPESAEEPAEDERILVAPSEGEGDQTGDEPIEETMDIEEEEYEMPMFDELDTSIEGEEE